MLGASVWLYQLSFCLWLSHDPMVVGSSPKLGISAQQGVCFSFSPAASPLALCVHSLSISLSLIHMFSQINK